MADDLKSRTGFDDEFLGDGFTTPFPVALNDIDGDLLDPLHYEHFSLALSKSRRMARWVAWNIDGANRAAPGTYERIGFRQDRRVRPDEQILDVVYRNNDVDRGHIARREDLLWGTHAEGLRANDDSFYFTNITPQMRTFNQSSRSGIWGQLENALLKATDSTKNRVSVFGGPILTPRDRLYRGIQVPRQFWKLFVYVLDDIPRVKAFVLSQRLDELEEFGPIVLPKKFTTFEIAVDELTARVSLGLSVYAEWASAEPELMATGVRAITKVDDIQW